jgi:hypothetical protein
LTPRQWFVTEHVREKFSCRSCETIMQSPAPFHVVARGFAGPIVLAMILVEKYANHQPLNRQSEQYAREGIELSVSTMADDVGACTASRMPLYELIMAHVACRCAGPHQRSRRPQARSAAALELEERRPGPLGEMAEQRAGAARGCRNLTLETLTNASHSGAFRLRYCPRVLTLSAACCLREKEPYCLRIDRFAAGRR